MGDGAGVVEEIIKKKMKVAMLQVRLIAIGIRLWWASQCFAL